MMRRDMINRLSFMLRDASGKQALAEILPIIDYFTVDELVMIHAYSDQLADGLSGKRQVGEFLRSIDNN